MVNRPTALTVLIDSVPDVLCTVARWLCWRYVWDGTRWSKLPFQPNNRAAKSNDPRTWSTFEKVVAAYRSDRFDGVGFVLGDGWAGLDLDHCRSASNAETNVAACPYMDRLDCYVEASPSGAGFKAIGRSRRIGGQIDFAVVPSAFTKWTSARYFAITGHVSGEGSANADITALLDEWFPASRTDTAVLPDVRPGWIRENDTRGLEGLERFTDDQVVERILTSPQAEKFIRLCRGDLSDYGGDHSRADQGFFGIVVYWTQGNLEQAERLFRQTKLMRDKWNTPSYRRATLRKAAQL